MRRLSVVVPVLITGVALYFALGFGADSVRILTSPVYGLDNPGFARIIYDVGRLMALGPDGLMRLAMFFGATKLAVAAICSIHVVERIGSLWGHKVDHDFLDAGLLLAILLTFVAAIPALIEVSPMLLAQHRPTFWLAGLAATLSVLEALTQNEAAFQPPPRRVESGFLPPRRKGASTLRWDQLRRAAGGRNG
jgi:hypothetical protein